MRKDKRTEKGLGGRLLPGQVYLAGAVCIEDGVLRANEIEEIGAAIALCVGA